MLEVTPLPPVFDVRFCLRPLGLVEARGQVVLLLPHGFMHKDNSPLEKHFC